MTEPPALPGVRHEHVNAAGLRVHVALAGPDDAPPVMLVHGWPQNWWAWRLVIPELMSRFRVIVPDLRGHGWSEAPASGYEKEQLTSDLFAVLDALGVGRVTWVGHDWGGWTGFLAALRAPDRLERFLAICIPHLWRKPDPRQLPVLLSYQGLVSMPFVGMKVADRLVRAILQSGRGGDSLPPADVAVFAERLPPHVTVAMYRTFLTREAIPIARGRYARRTLKVPATVLLGDRDVVTKGIESGQVDGQPQLQVQRLENVAHWVPEQRPEAIVSWLVDGRLDGGRDAGEQIH